MRTFIALLFVMAGMAMWNGVSAQDAKATEILESSKAKFTSLKDFSADFRYELSGPGLNGTLVKEGDLTYKQGMYALIMKGDNAEEIFCDKENLWIYQKGENEVNILPYDPDEAMNVEVLFNLYEASAAPRYDGTESLNGRTAHRIYMAIKDRSLEFNQALLWIDKSTNLPLKAELVNRTQSKTVIEFINPKINRGVSVSAFRFDPEAYPNVEVYDER